MVRIRLEATTRRFGSTVALDDVSLDLPSGSFTSLLGPSGCGKTTLLRLIAGFETPDDGSISFDGETMARPGFHIPPEKRGVGVVFQSYALWPHMDVCGNIEYPLTTRGLKASERERQVRDVLATVGLEGYEKRRIDELSGGQRQRVALARCLVSGARIILFDEPLANLDMHLRASMVDVFRDVHQRSGATMVYVTHDQAEALALSDRIAVMDRGRILQHASPQDVYRAPAHRKVAGFVGRGAVLEAKIVGNHGKQLTVEVAGFRFAARSNEQRTDGAAHVLLRPENLHVADVGIPARVVSTTYRGPVFETLLTLNETQSAVVIDCVDSLAIGCDVRVAVSDAWIIPA